MLQSRKLQKRGTLSLHRSGQGEGSGIEPDRLVNQTSAGPTRGVCTPLLWGAIAEHPAGLEPALLSWEDRRLPLPHGRVLCSLSSVFALNRDDLNTVPVTGVEPVTISV